MTRRLAALSLPLLALAGCEQVTTQPVEYAPGDVGTVDYALCLLGFTGVPMRELPTGHQTVELVLNGQNATFVVDTGANVSVLHAPYARRFGISGASLPAGAVGIGGAQQATQARVETLRIGPAPIRQNRIVVADLSQVADLLGPLAGGTVSGIIGQDVLAEHRAVIDVARSILYIMVADEDPAPVAADRCEPEEDAGEGEAAQQARPGRP